MVTQIKAGRANQIAHIFNKQQIQIIKSHVMQGIMHQMSIQMASRTRSDLISGDTLRLNPFGVIFRFQIAFDDGDF